MRSTWWESMVQGRSIGVFIITSAVRSAFSSTRGCITDVATQHPGSSAARRRRYTSLSSILTEAPRPRADAAAARPAMPAPSISTSQGIMPATPPSSIPLPWAGDASIDEAIAIAARPSISLRMSANGVWPSGSPMRSMARATMLRFISSRTVSLPAVTLDSMVSSIAPRFMARRSGRVSVPRVITMSA